MKFSGEPDQATHFEFCIVPLRIGNDAFATLHEALLMLLQVIMEMQQM